MSALADRPEEDDNKNNLSSFINKDRSELPLEKQLTHILFCQEISNIDIDSARKLLEQLHHLYLSQQYVVSKIAKQEFLGNM